MSPQKTRRVFAWLTMALVVIIVLSTMVVLYVPLAITMFVVDIVYCKRNLRKDQQPRLTEHLVYGAATPLMFAELVIEIVSMKLLHRREPRIPLFTRTMERAYKYLADRDAERSENAMKLQTGNPSP
jgi:hypothetical protein